MHKKFNFIENLKYKENIINDFINYTNTSINDIAKFILKYESEICLEHNLIENAFEFNDLKNTQKFKHYLNRKYPYYKFLIKTINKKKYKNFKKLITDFEKDRNELIKLGFITNDVIFSIEFGKGDFHSHLKSTLILLFEDGNRLIYKPRKVNTEKFTESFIKILEQNLNLNLNLKIPQNLTKSTYSWHKYITHNATDSESYLKNIGHLLSLSYILNSRDFINDNIIINNDDIYLIDPESIISPNIENFGIYRSKINELFDTSVINSGILPVPYGSLDKTGMISALFFVENNDDNKHLPIINNKHFEIKREDIDTILKSFENISLQIQKNKTKILRELNSLFSKKIYIRLLFNTTELYATLINEMLIPEYLNDIEKYKVLLKKSFPNFKKTLKESIKKQILNLDVPFYYSDSKGSVYDGYKNLIFKKKEFGFNDCMKKTFIKIKNLDNEIIHFNSMLIRKTIELELDKRGMISIPDNTLVRLTNETEIKFNKENYLKASEKIALRLINESIVIGDDINWVHKSINPSNGSISVQPLSSDLYDGTIGISILLHYLSQYSENPIFRNTNNLLRKKNKTLIEKFITPKNKFYKTFSLSVFNFPLSNLLLDLHIYKDLTVDEFESNLTTYINFIKDILNDDLIEIEEFDYLQGISAIADKLIDIYVSHDFIKLNLKNDIEVILKKILLLIIDNSKDFGDSCAWSFKMQIGDTIVENYLNGFSHGVSGILFVLKKASMYFDIPELKNTIKKALNYEKSLFDNDTNSWYDFRLNKKDADMAAWCHGSAGIGLSKILLMSFEKNEAMKSELVYSCENIIKSLNLLNFSLCHGNLSNIEILKSAGRILQNDYYESISENFINKLSLEILNDKIPKVSETGNLNYNGMFIGLTGVAYQLLRFYNWEETPSIICLETNLYKYKTLH
ncbi:DUF4135 domain-containing protein [Flavobacterium jumunjinense]|uniref:DUF4135 domain-containing protein n=2 Tax=Flavobacterium jumunjinense TaxID=998845 RepID=A0ABV5GM29_9FLAO|nr:MULTISPECIES: DUF4135 domain-containing protein [Flavobacterium]